MGTRESLNGRKNVARRKVENGEKSPWGQCLTRPVPNGHRRPGFLLVPENLCLRSSRRFLFFFVPYIFFCPFRLSFAPFICPWVSEDDVQLKTVQNNCYKQNIEEAVNFVTWYKSTSAVKPDSKSLYCRTYAIKNYETVEIYP